MCLAILCPSKTIIAEDKLFRGFTSNPDGAGFAYVDNGEVVISKGYMNFPPFYKAYKSAREKYPDSPFLIHFRIRTQGARDESNTHPFPIRDGAVIHNGSISGTVATAQIGPSDTACFATKFKESLTFDVLNKHKAEFETALGSYNKLVFLFKDGKHVILNEKAGGWMNEEGGEAWFSNTYFNHTRKSMGGSFHTTPSTPSTTTTSVNPDGKNGTYSYGGIIYDEEGEVVGVEDAELWKHGGMME